MSTIQILTFEQIDQYVDHLSRQLPEPGIDGILWQPCSADEPIDKVKLKSKISERWSTKPGIGNWEVAWGLIEGDKIVGHIDLIGSSQPAFSHRAKLGMGIEQKFRSRGFGKLLMKAALDWARSQEFLSWVDLEVFAHNPVAIKIYQSFGFKPVGKTLDRIRVGSQSIDDWHFVLNLKSELGLPEGFSIKECNSDEFHQLVGRHSETIFDESELNMRPRSFMSEIEKNHLEELAFGNDRQFSLYLVVFFKNQLAGWTYGYQDNQESFCMLSSAILPEFRGRSLYSTLLDHIVDRLTARGFQRIWSSHKMTNNKIIVPKLKKGFIITGMRVSDRVGTIVELTLFTNQTRKKIMDFRVGRRPDQEIKDIFKI